jgi:hypothetical protein
MKFFMRKQVIFSSIALLIPITVFGWGVELPLSVIPKDSMLGKGKVIVVTNISDDYIHECAITVNQQSSETITIPTLKPHESKNIGWLELGYELRVGDQIAINCKKYVSSFIFKINK